MLLLLFNVQDVVMSLGVRGYPTFHFYVGGQKVDELVGADPGTLESKIQQHKVPFPPLCTPFSGILAFLTLIYCAYVFYTIGCSKWYGRTRQYSRLERRGQPSKHCGPS